MGKTKIKERVQPVKKKDPARKICAHVSPALAWPGYQQSDLGSLYYKILELSLIDHLKIVC